MFRKIIVYIHKILGIPLSILFVLWFLSGFAMIWSSFPHARQPQGQPALSSTILPADSLASQQPDSMQLESLSLTTKYGLTCYKATAGNSTIEVQADSFQPMPEFNDSLRRVVLAQWCNAPISRIDTLSEVDQWIPFERWADRMPIYKYHFDDPESHELYMTPEGDIIQFTSAKDRRLAWIGAIPHWMYYTPLRKHQKLWTEIVNWSALLGCLMCITGIIAAISVWWKQRRVGGFFHCPYRKPWWHWHFILGLLFGWCAITFAFSGYMSMTDLPGFLKKEQPGAAEKERGMHGRHPNRPGRSSMLPIGDYKLPAAAVIASDEPVLNIAWRAWNGHPYYAVTYSYSTRNIDASAPGDIKDFTLAEEMIRRDAVREIPDSIQWTIDLIDSYDSDYYGRDEKRHPLPVYKVTLQDYMHTVMYYNPKTLAVTRVDDNSRTRRLLYSGLHALNLKFLTDTPWLWYTVMLVLLTGGLLLSITGLALAWQWLVRTIRRFHKQS